MSSNQFSIKLRKSRAIFKSRPGQALNRREYMELKRNVHGFLVPDYINNGKTFEIRYDFSNAITLDEFLQVTVLSKTAFANLILQIIGIVKYATERKFDLNLLNLSTDSMFFFSSDWEVKALYLPVQPYSFECSLKNLFTEISQKMQLDPYEDSEFRMEFIYQLRSLSFSIYEMEEFANKLLGNSEPKVIESRSKCLKCGANITDKDIQCPICGASVGNKNDDCSQLFAKDETKATLLFLNNTNFTNIHSERGLTGIQGSSVKLNDLINNKMIGIDHFPYRLGKDPEWSDYTILSKYVSRIHAQIEYENGLYSILDLTSTNGTYVNGEKVMPGQTMILKDGDIIALSSTYKFKIILS